MKHIRGVCVKCDQIEVDGDGTYFWRIPSPEERGQIVRAMLDGFKLYSKNHKKVCPRCQK
ncbi:MAG: hypothetical protein V1804_00295 [Patescibacteria group bacterium]